MKEWLEDETRNSAKAHELRVKDATELVNAYAEGKLTPGQALEQMVRYDRRWGEALPGTSAGSHQNDEDIVRAIDRSHDEHDRLFAAVASQRGEGKFR